MKNKGVSSTVNKRFVKKFNMYLFEILINRIILENR